MRQKGDHVTRASALGWIAWVVVAGSLCKACRGQSPENTPSVITVPAGFPSPKIPEDNPATAEKIELGRFLFYDKRLSGNQTQSCASCHRQELAFSDGRTTAEGSTGQAHPRNSPSLTNAVYNATLTWANPILVDLEKQLLIPIFGDDPIELGATGVEDEIIKRLEADSRYPEMFAQAFPSEKTITWDLVIQAIASFTRSLISGNSPFDQFVYQGDRNALSPAALRGMELFFSEARPLQCHHCHGGFNFTESTVHASSAFDAELFHNTGLYNIDGQGAYPGTNTGVFAITSDPNDMGKFRAPTLRNIAVTAPYMHDGSIDTLENVIRFYEAGGRHITEGPKAGDGRISPLKSGLIAGFTLSESERRDLIEFLKSLTDESFLTNPQLSEPDQAQF